MLQGHFQAMEDMYVKEAPVKEVRKSSPAWPWMSGPVFTLNFCLAGKNLFFSSILIKLGHPVYVQSRKRNFHLSLIICILLIIFKHVVNSLN